MSLLDRRRERGFWRKKEPLEPVIQIDQLSLEILKEKGFVIIDSGESRYQVIIRNEDWKKSGDLSEKDLEIIPLPKAAKF